MNDEKRKPQLPTAQPVARKPTPTAMPAPPANRQSHDDIESVIEKDRLERERVQLLLKKQIAKSTWGKRAIGLGVCAALALGAFNSARSIIPIQKAEATQARLAQSEKVTEDQLRARIKQEEQTLAALRASNCYFKQIRGALQRQGLDLTSLPGGGIKVTRVADDDPNRVGAPRFIVEEKCPDFPQLPREQ